MKRIKGMTEIKVSVEDINHLNGLIDRDEAMPILVKRYNYVSNEFANELCPKCKRLVVSSYSFCPGCGQRLDWENEEL